MELRDVKSLQAPSGVSFSFSFFFYSCAALLFYNERHAYTCNKIHGLAVSVTAFKAQNSVGDVKKCISTQNMVNTPKLWSTSYHQSGINCFSQSSLSELQFWDEMWLTNTFKRLEFNIVFMRPEKIQIEKLYFIILKRDWFSIKRLSPAGQQKDVNESQHPTHR